MPFENDKPDETRALDVPTTNKINLPHQERGPVEKFEFKDMITTGNIEEVRKRNAAQSGSVDEHGDLEAKKKGGRPKKAE